MSGLSFQEALTRGVLVFDGAMGTEIYRHHVFTDRSFDELCLSEPKLVPANPLRLPRRRGGRADDQHLRGKPRGAGQVRPGRKAAGDRPGGRPAGPRGGRRGRPADVCGRLDRPAAQPAAARGDGRRDGRRAGARAAGGRGRLHPFRDATEPGRPGTLRGRHEPFAGRPLRALVRRHGDRRDGVRRVGRADAGPLAGRLRRANRLGPELRRRARRIARGGRAGGAAEQAPAGGATQRRHPEGSGEPPHLPLLARVPGHLRQTVRRLGRVGGGRLLRDHAGAYPRGGDDGQAAAAAEGVGHGGAGGGRGA